MDLIVLLLSLGASFQIDRMRYRGVQVVEKFLSCNWILRWCICYVVFFMIIVFGVYGPGYDRAAFIYFQF